MHLAAEPQLVGERPEAAQLHHEEDGADHQRADGGGAPRPAAAVPGGQEREARDRVAGEEAERDRGDREVAGQDRQAQHAGADERQHPGPEHRQRYRHRPRAEPSHREHRADDACERDRRPRDVRELRDEQPRHLRDPPLAAEVLGQRARGGDRVQRVAGDDEVDEAPDHRRDEDEQRAPTRRPVSAAGQRHSQQAREDPALGPQQPGEHEQPRGAAPGPPPPGRRPTRRAPGTARRRTPAPRRAGTRSSSRRTPWPAARARRRRARGRAATSPRRARRGTGAS